MQERPSNLARLVECVFLRAPWLTRGRALAYCSIAGLYGWGLFLGMCLFSHYGKNFGGQPICADFVSFWTASLQTLQGHLPEVYDRTKHHMAELAAFKGLSFGNFAFYYPPTYLLVCLPLALLPYSLSLLTFLVVTMTAFVRAMRRLLPQDWALMPILAFPGLILGVATGQNGLLTGALFAWAAVLLSTSPFCAGACLGLLVIKPQLLGTVPVVLLCAHRWRAIAGGLCSGVLMLGLSWVAFGRVGWSGFLRMSHEARAVFEFGYVEAWKMQSVFAAVRLLHGPLWLAYGMQAAMAGVALVVSGWLVACLRRATATYDGWTIATGQISVMIAAMPFCSPFLLDYDLACFAVPMAWIAREGLRGSWWSGEKFVLFVGYAYLLSARLIAEGTLINPTPPVATALLFVLARRIAPERWRQVRRLVTTRLAALRSAAATETAARVTAARVGEGNQA